MRLFKIWKESPPTTPQSQKPKPN